jgi:hypothetical protein
MIKKIMITLIITLLFIGSVNAWVIDDKQGRVQGTVDFYSDGSGILNVTGGPVIDFSWHQTGNTIRSNYLFYGIDVYYNASTDELYSPDVGNVTLKR